VKDRSTLQANVVGLLLDLYGFSFGFQNCIISLPSFLHTSLGGQLSLQVRSRDAASRLDRYMLVTCDDASDCIKVVDKYPFTHFMRALKSVQARDLTNIGGALQRIFSFLHVQRLAHDIDRYGNPTTTTFLAFVFSGSFFNP
jgi:hypothetical protein